MEKQTALITGASGGLGYEFTKILAEKNCDLILVARNEKKMNEIKNSLEEKYGIHVYVCAADLSEKDAALNVFSFVQQESLSVDILINNAGFGDSGSFVQSSWQKQYQMVQLNITALMQMTHCFLKPMIAQGHGRIMNVSSVAAFCAGPYMSIYYATKAFVLSFSEALSEEVRGSGVTVTALCPGPTKTGFEKAAAMGTHSVMFSHAASADKVAREGIRALFAGKAVCYCGIFTRSANILSRISPRSVSRKFARLMNR